MIVEPWIVGVAVIVVSVIWFVVLVIITKRSGG
jgi:hypothetical protein